MRFAAPVFLLSGVASLLGVLSTIDNWAWDPCRDSLDSFAWYVRKSREPLPVRLAMMAILAGAVAMMGDDDPGPT